MFFMWIKAAHELEEIIIFIEIQPILNVLRMIYDERLAKYVIFEITSALLSFLRNNQESSIKKTTCGNLVDTL